MHIYKKCKQYSKRIIPLVTASVIVLASAFAAHAATPDSIHLSWQHDPATTMTIMWRVNATDVPARVEYGTTSALGSSQTGTSTDGVAAGSHYQTVELTGLTSNTTYFYRVQGSGGDWSAVNTFRTAPTGAQDFNFTVFADNGVDANSPDASVTIKDRIASEHPAFHLVAGDLSYADGDTCGGSSCVREHWEDWFEEMDLVGKTAPIMPAIGNHEKASDMRFPWGEYYYTRSFALAPEHEAYYSFDYGDAHIVSLDSNDESGLSGGYQYAWLDADLAATTKRWKVIYFHHPPFSSGEHGSEDFVQERLVPLFDRHHVDVVITGHDHLYQRTLPLRDGPGFNTPVITTSERMNYTNPTGTIYVVTGGGGHSTYDFDAHPSWEAASCGCVEYVKVAVSASGTLTLQAKNLSGSALDTFTITKTSTGSTSTPSPNPDPISTPATGTVSNFPVRGFNFPSWWHNTYDRSETRTSLTNARSLGANWVSINPFWYQATETSNTIRPHSDGNKTASDDSVRSIIRYAKSQGLHVALKPLVDAENGVWRGFFRPSDHNAWFASYRSFMLHFADLAQAEHADMLVIGTELRELTKPEYTTRWRDLIDEIRSRYTGTIVYNANWDGELEHIQFWDAVDSIGVSAYFPVATSTSASTTDMVNGWSDLGSRHTKRLLEDLHNQWSKPVIFTEIGYESCNGASVEPWNCSGGLDIEEQRRAYEAALTAWNDVPWFQGMLFWMWETDPDRGGTSDDSWTVHGKTAETVVRNFWQSATASGDLSPTAPVPTPTPAPAPDPVPVPVPVPEPTSTTPPPTAPIPYAYGEPRESPEVEARAARTLLTELISIFGVRPSSITRTTIVPYMKAYLYGGYPSEIIAQAIRGYRRVMHPTIPWSMWRNSATYQYWITR